MDWLDEAVRHAAPSALGSDPATAREAEATARAVLAEAPQRTGPSSLRRISAGSAVGLSILGFGVTAATAGPAVVDWLEWTPDVVAQRSFDLGDGSALGLCEVFIRVTPEYRHDLPDDEVDRRVEEAREFLTEHDWEPLISSISERAIEAAFAAEVAQRSTPMIDGTMPPPATLSLVVGELMSHRVVDKFERAGHLRQGVGLEAAGGPCDGATEGPTR